MIETFNKEMAIHDSSLGPAYFMFLLIDQCHQFLILYLDFQASSFEYIAFGASFHESFVFKKGYNFSLINAKYERIFI